MVNRRTGVNRQVFLVARWAIKIPHLNRGRVDFLTGWLSNVEEWHLWKTTRNRKLCPVQASIAFGIITIMPRMSPLTKNDWQNFDANRFCTEGFFVPSEYKPSSFGWLGNRIVAVDYS